MTLQSTLVSGVTEDWGGEACKHVGRGSLTLCAFTSAGREDMGPLLGVVGGWAGGEAGLWKLREQYQVRQDLGQGCPAMCAWSARAQRHM